MAASKKQLLTVLFRERGFYRQMLKIALPVMLQNLITSFVNMIDTVMVGRLGETEIAAVGIANQYFFIFLMFMLGLGAGCGVFIAQFWGQGDIRNIRRVLGVGLWSAILFSSVFVAFGYPFSGRIIAVFNKEAAVIDLGRGYLEIVLAGYVFTGITIIYNVSLRSIGNALLPMLMSLAALVCNVFFNYMFIFGNFGAPALGVRGAALATLLARAIETAIIILYVYKEKGILAASLRELTGFNWPYVKKSYATILPVILNDICWGSASLVYAVVYGRMGTQAVAAIQIVNTVTNLFLIFIFGMSNAAAVMIGNAVGAGKIKQGRLYAARFVVLSIIAGVLLGILLAVCAPYILSFFNVSSKVQHDARIILNMAAAVFVVRLLNNTVIVGILRGGGDARFAFVAEGITMWLIGVPLTVISALVFKLPVHLVYAAGLMEEIVKSIFVLLRLASGRWVKNVTHGLKTV